MLLGIVVGLVVVAVLTVAVARDLRGQIRDRRHLDRLATDGPGDEEEVFVPPSRIERRLLAAGLRTDPLSFVSATAVFVIVVTLGVQRLISDNPVAALAAAGIAVGLVWVALEMVGGRRARKFEAKLGDALSLMIGGLKAGANLTQSFAVASEASVGAVRKEFGEVARRLGLGMAIRRALKPISEGYDSRGIRLFTQTVIAKWQAGGDLAPVLEKVNRVIRDRLRLRWRLERDLGPTRLAAFLMALIPYLLIPLFLWQQPQWINRLLADPLGQKLVIAAVAVQILAALWLRSMFKIEL
ncbi:MAG: type II secretion system F family protein [Thermoanaerobaculia bacterium]